MADKRRYTFLEKKRSKGGVFAAKMALASFALFLIDVAVSFAYSGKAGAAVGAVGVTAMLLAAVGFYSGMKSFGEKDVSPTWSVIGSIASGVVLIVWLAMLLGGIG